MIANGAHDLGPVVAEVRLAADDGHLFDSELGHLAHEVETLRGAELVRPSMTGTRAAVPAGQIAFQRDLPHRVDGAPSPIDVARFSGEGQLAARRSRVRCDREHPLPR